MCLRVSATRSRIEAQIGAIVGPRLRWPVPLGGVVQRTTELVATLWQNALLRRDRTIT